MKSKTEQLTEQQMKTINGGDGIIAYDPVTGKPFAEENGGYPPTDQNDDGSSNPAFGNDGTMSKAMGNSSF